MELKYELDKHGFTFNKRYGQNFITDKNFLDSIVAKSGVEEGDTVLEIGAGAGTLTEAIARKAKHVVAFEIDTDLKPVLEERLESYDNIELVFGDFMKEECVEEFVGGEYKVVANLPYYITTPVLFKLIEDTSVPPLSVSVMVQREVADRLCASAGTKDYGALTVAVDARYKARKIIDVNRNMFMPVPNVDSAVVLMTKREEPVFHDLKAFSRLVRVAFAMRRKTLINNLSAAYDMPKPACEHILVSLGLSPTVRGEALTTEQFAALCERIQQA